MQIKVLERQTAGYSQQVLVTFLRRTLFPSSFFNQPVPVRGICFIAGAESFQLARGLAETELGLGTISLQMEAMTIANWHDITNLITQPRAEVSKVGFILRDLDLAAPDLQQKVADTLAAADNVLWLATASDQQKLSPEVKLPMLVYLGLSQAGNMSFLAQNGQRLQIDKPATPSKQTDETGRICRVNQR
ncbi:MAG: hypothetical protein WCO56_24770 [Verrucomicrobiota bacterium]